jgi:small-conductance mechanosensitive channel
MKASTSSVIVVCALAAGACASAPAARPSESACSRAEALAERRNDLVLQRGRAQADAEQAARRQSEAAQAARTGAGTTDLASTQPAPGGSANVEKTSVSAGLAELARLDREIAQLDGSAKSLPTADACRAAGLP